MTLMADFIITTPAFTDHARLRCEQMGLTTKRVKQAFRRACLDYPGPERHGDNRVRVGDGLAIAYTVVAGTPLVYTVLWDGIEFTRPDA